MLSVFTSVLIAIAVLGLGLPCLAQSTVVRQPPEISERASTASAAVASAAKIAEWVNALGVSQVVDRSLREQDQHIAALLHSTGQPGVLAYVQIERSDAVVPVYDVVGDKVLVIGAGTTVDDVYFAYSQTDTMRATRSGAQLDIDRSYFLWFTKSGEDVQVTSTPARFVIYPAAQRRSDVKLRDTLLATADGRALGLAVDNLERSAKSADLKKQIAALKAQQAETNKNVAKIDSELQREIERARKAAVVANQLATMAGIFTIAAQVSSASSYLGSDTTPEVANARNPEQLRSGVDSILSDAVQRPDELQIQYNSSVDQRSGLRAQYLQILTVGKYPTGDVPQIKP